MPISRTVLKRCAKCGKVYWTRQVDVITLTPFVCDDCQIAAMKTVGTKLATRLFRKDRR